MEKNYWKSRGIFTVRKSVKPCLPVPIILLILSCLCCRLFSPWDDEVTLAFNFLAFQLIVTYIVRVTTEASTNSGCTEYRMVFRVKTTTHAQSPLSSAVVLLPKTISHIFFITTKNQMTMAADCVDFIVTLFLDHIGCRTDAALSMAMAAIVWTLSPWETEVKNVWR